MKRETVNWIRWTLEEVVPPFIRDSAVMRWLFRVHWGRLIDDIEVFRARIPFLSAAEYKSIYERMPRIQNETDNSEACLEAILGATVGTKVLDMGCGTGYVVDWLAARNPTLTLAGADFIIEEGTAARSPNITFTEAMIEALPFEDGAFDTVVCTHVLEHILDFGKALSELRRVAAKRVIIIVPQEREYRFTFNPHLHFFPYPHSFLRYITPVPARHHIRSIGRDIFYYEDLG